MNVSLPPNICDIKVYDIDGDILTFDNMEDLNNKIKNCNIQPIVSCESIEIEDNEFEPKFIVKEIKIISYIL